MNLRRQLPCVLIATLAVVLIPLLSVTAFEAVTGLRSPLLAVALVVAVSFGVASAGAALWARQRGSRDLVFGDLMLWGWIRRLRTERRLARVSALLGLGRFETSALDTDLTPKEQTDLLERLATSLEARDPHTHGHSRRVTRYAEMIAKGMGLSDDQVAMVRTAATVHDVGKIEIPREVLNKPGKLTDEEFEIIKRHPVVGCDMVAVLGDPEMTSIVRHHHERLDGRGYPDRLAGDEIPLGARIIAVADTFDAITSTRPYRPAMVHHRALEILKKEAGPQLDQEAVTAFLSYYSGSRSASRWSLLVTAPERIAASLRQALHATTAAPLAKNALAVAATALLGSSLAAPIANAVDGGNLTQSAERTEVARGGSTAANGDAPAGMPVASGAVLRAHGSHAAGAERRSSRLAGEAVQPGDPDRTGRPEAGAAPGSRRGTHGKPDSAPGKPSSPGRSGSVPDRAGRPAAPAPPRPVQQPAAPGKGGDPGGQDSKPASPGGAPADAPANAGGGKTS
jgi:HD-GYP domain-containing protein (c-di-GMP phosphodiesterase class II)